MDRARARGAVDWADWWALAAKDPVLAEPTAERFAIYGEHADGDMPSVHWHARTLREAGFAATVHDGPVGEQLCQQHCPVAHVAHEFPQLCEAETEVFARVLGSHVQRLATIAHGDGVCTTSIPDLTRTQSARSIPITERRSQ